VLITGEAGFIGSAVVKQFINETGITVINVDAGNLESLASMSNHPCYFFEHADMLCRAAVECIFLQCKPDIVRKDSAPFIAFVQFMADEYVGYEDELEIDCARQDFIVLSLQRACEVSIGAVMHQVRVKGLSVHQESRDTFRMLEEVGFRNVTAHDYQKLNLAIVYAICDESLFVVLAHGFQGT